MASALSTASAHGDWRLLFIQRDRIAAVTADDVNRVAKTYFQKQNRTVGIYIPTQEAQRLAIPAATGLDALVKDYKGGTVKEGGEVFDPSPANLDARTKIVEAPGLKAGLLAKKNRGDTVSLVLTLHYGNEQSLKDFTMAAGMLPGMMMAGTKKHDRQALREEMESLGIRISSGFGGGGVAAARAVEAVAGWHPRQLTFSSTPSVRPCQRRSSSGEILREPAFPMEEFETSKRRMKSGMAGSATDPTHWRQ